MDDLAVGERLIVDVGKHSVGVFNIGGELFALRNLCPHAGAEVCLGSVSGAPLFEDGRVTYGRHGHVLRCPWHGWEFDLTSGESLTEPTRRIKRHEVEIEDGWVYVVI